LARDHQPNNLDIDGLHFSGFGDAGREVESDSVVDVKKLLPNDIVLVNVDAVACEVLLDEPKSSTTRMYNGACDHGVLSFKVKQSASTLPGARRAFYSPGYHFFS
jgi:hypothetical protein